jgi:hypothetical protein
MAGRGRRPGRATPPPVRMLRPPRVIRPPRLPGKVPRCDLRSVLAAWVQETAKPAAGDGPSRPEGLSTRRWELRI